MIDMNYYIVIYFQECLANSLQQPVTFLISKSIIVYIYFEYVSIRPQGYF